MHSHDSIQALATAPFRSAVAVVRVSGRHLQECFSPWIQLPPPREARLRHLRWKGFDEQALVLFFPEPASYTGEDLVEFHLHGNPLLVAQFQVQLANLGIRSAEPGEFTRRSLLNGKRDLLKAEALKDLIDAATDQQIRQAQNRLGCHPQWISELQKKLGIWMAQAEAVVDYGEDEGMELDRAAMHQDLELMEQRLRQEKRRASGARWLRDGIRLALVGRPNSGKSTLFNALLGADRAIVTEIPGTTRDVLEQRCEWAGLPLILYDTAGLRESEDPIERLGQAKVQEILATADGILHLVPAYEKASAEILRFLEPVAEKTLLVRTFGDLQSSHGMCISALKGDLRGLEWALRDRYLSGQSPDACLGALDTARQREILDELLHQIRWILELPKPCPPELPASLLQGAWELLARLTGADRVESALDQLFSGFCLGK